MTQVPPNEQMLTLRPGPLLRGLAVALVLCMAAIGGIAQLTDHPRANALWAIGGLVLTGAFFVGGAFVIASGKPRPISSIATLWLASTVGRVIGLGIVGFSLYFAAPKDAWRSADADAAGGLQPLAIGAGGAYLVCLIVETVMVARQALRTHDSAS